MTGPSPLLAGPQPHSIRFTAGALDRICQARSLGSVIDDAGGVADGTFDRTESNSFHAQAQIQHFSPLSRAFSPDSRGGPRLGRTHDAQADRCRPRLLLLSA